MKLFNKAKQKKPAGVKKFGIRAELNIWILTFVIIFSITQVLCLLYISRLNNMKNKEIKESVISNVSICLENKLEVIDKISSSLISDDKLTSFMKSGEKSQDIFAELMRDVYNIQMVNVDVIYVVLVDTSGKTYNLTTTASLDELRKIETVYNEYAARKDSGIVSDYDFFDIQSFSHSYKYLCGFSQIKAFDYDRYISSPLGTLIVCAKVDTRNFFQYSDYDNMVELELKSDYKSISLVTNADKYKIGEKLSLNGSLNNTAGWKVEGNVYLGTEGNLIYKFRNIFLCELLIIMIFGFVWQTMLSKRISRPLKSIMKYLSGWNMVEKIDKLDIKGNRDIELFAYNINDVLDRNRDLARDLVNKQQILYDIEIAKKEALIYAMQNQVNPHFLYNVLELIRNIAVVYEVPEIENISVSIADIFRYNLHDHLKATIREEVEIAKKYLYVSRQRFGDVFDVRFDIPDDVIDEKIIRMVFQPVLENVFNHGIGDFKRRLIIVIKARITDDDNIEISITDNGRGIDEKQLREMNEKLSINEPFSKRKIGLANLNNRLKLSYEPEGKLAVYSRKNCYTKIVLLIPRDKNQ